MAATNCTCPCGCNAKRVNNDSLCGSTLCERCYRGRCMRPRLPSVTLTGQ